MADNSAQTAADTIRDKDRAGVKTQIVGLDLGIGTGTESLMSGVMPIVDQDVSTTGTITATDAVVAAPAGAGAFVTGASTGGSLVALACPGGDSVWNVQITGLTSGTLYFEESLDSTTGTDGNWIAVNGRQTGIVNTVLGYSATANGYYRGNTSGSKWMRVRAVGALTGTPAIRINISSGTGAIFLNASVPTGTNTIGNVGGVGVAGTPAGGVVTVQGVASGTAQPVSGTFWQATQPVSLATNTPTLAAGTNVVGTVNTQPATLLVTGTAVISTGVTVTLPAVASAFHYITSIKIQRYAAAALTGAATPVLVTSTNLPGSPVWSIDTVDAIGVSKIQFESYAGNPLKSSTVNTATTIVAPIYTNAIWRITVTYYTAA